MAKASIIFDTRRPLANGKYPVRIRIYHKSAFFIYTGVEINKEAWSNNEVNSKDKLHKTKNTRIISKLAKVSNILLALETSGELRRLSNAQLRKRIEGSTTTEINTLIDYFHECINTKIKKRTQEIYQQTIVKIEEFTPTVTIEDVDINWLQQFELYLIKQGIAINTVGIHLRNIRAVFNHCLDNEYISHYPFRKFKIKKEKTPKRSLTIEQLRILKDYPCEKHLERYRDIFMLSFYLIGINMIDILYAKKIVNGRLEYRRAKTSRLYSIKVPPEAMKIINKYRGKEYLINIMDTYSDHKSFISQINKYLKRIGPVEIIGQGGKKKVTPLFPELSTYWARHTWATIAASLDIPKETISHALGHGNDTVTDIYIDFDLSKVDEANEKVIAQLV